MSTSSIADKETGKDQVEIFVNDVPLSIHRGRRKVSEIKQLAGVAIADELAEVVAGKLTPLADEGAVTIKGGERFVSYPKDSGSSS